MQLDSQLNFFQELHRGADQKPLKVPPGPMVDFTGNTKRAEVRERARTNEFLTLFLLQGKTINIGFEVENFNWLDGDWMHRP